MAMAMTMTMTMAMANGDAEVMHADFLPHRRARLVSSTKAMPLSQSPDSVMAFKDGTTANEGGTVSGTPPCGVIGIDIQPAASSALHPLLSSAPSPQTSTKRATNTVVNPYIKVTPSASTVAAVDPKLRKRKQFVDKYRMQALQQNGNYSGRQHDAAVQHSTSYRVGPEAMASPISAWNMHSATQQWRHFWRDSNRATRQNQQILNGTPLRPRLFLIRSRNGANVIAALNEQDQSARHQPSQTDRTTSLSQQQQHMYDEGIWELGNGITEISGEGGSGKTQICLSLCVTCAMTPPLYPNNSEADFGNQSTRDQNIQHYTALYISMGEGVRSITIARRLEQMVQARLNRTYSDNQVKQLLSRIGLISLRNEEEFMDFVDHDLPNILSAQRHHHHHHHQQWKKQHQHRQQQQQQQSTKIALIVFDGIAGFFRFSDPLFQFQKNNSTFHQQRGARLLHISSQLRRLSDLYDVPILITNQVTASIPPNGTSSSSMNPYEQQVVPALGLAWSNCVTTRYILQRKNEMTVSNEKCRNQDNTILAKNQWMRVRLARVLQSVSVPMEREVRFVIETGGVVAVT